MFSSGIDGAVWGGPISSTSWYFFKDVHYIRLNSAVGGEPWPVEFGPERTGASWAPASDTWFGTGFDAALHTLNTKKSFLTHLFKGNEYMAVNLDGNALTPAVDGPRPLRDVWRLRNHLPARSIWPFTAQALKKNTSSFSQVCCAHNSTAKTERRSRLCRSRLRHSSPPDPCRPTVCARPEHEMHLATNGSTTFLSSYVG